MRRNQLGLKASNVLLSTAVVALFMLLLVLAMAQEQVLTSLSKSPNFKNYNSSRIDSAMADEGEIRIKKLVDERQALTNEDSLRDREAAQATMIYTREVVRLEPIIKKLDAAKGCTILRQPILPAAKMTEREKQIQTKQAELSSLRACLEFDKAVDDVQRRTYLAALAKAETASENLNAAETRRRIIAARLEAIGKELWRERKELEAVAATRAHFRVTDALETPSWFPANPVNFPPFVVHVLLSFFSGAFGALLITMVFLVYPSKLRERVSPKLYYRRIFLGGLVAVTVFIVLAGGASILGTGQGAQVGTNFMSFTAIGLLAGMFSDTVADWLSARAKTMFSVEDDEDKDDETEGKEGRS